MEDLGKELHRDPREILDAPFVVRIEAGRSRDEIGNILMETHFANFKSVRGKSSKPQSRRWNNTGLLADECQRIFLIICYRIHFIALWTNC